MAEMFTTLGTWNWLIFGFIMMALELLAPGVFMFWLGLAALLVGLLSFVINPSWQTQLLMFAVFALARWTATTNAQRSSGDYATHLLDWYRKWDRDSSEQPATAVELRQMLEAYRRGRRRGRVSSLRETNPVSISLPQ